MANEKTTASPMLAQREGKLVIGGGIAGVGTLVLDALAGEGAINLTETQKTIVLVGVFALGAAYIISRGLAKVEAR